MKALKPFLCGRCGEESATIREARAHRDGHCKHAMIIRQTR